MTFERARQRFRSHYTQVDAAVFNRRDRGLRDCSRLSKLVLTEFLKLSEDANGLAD